MTHYDVCVIGGGASGLTAAITAARRGRSVLIYEAYDRVGKKLLATGNGRCNLAPAALRTDAYNDAFAPELIARAGGVDAVTEFFRSMGLVIAQEEDRLYPASFAATSVLGVLRAECERLGVTVTTGRAVDHLLCRGGQWVFPDATADKVILATGSAATFGHDSLGLLGGQGVRIEPLHPALVPLLCDPALVKGLRGVRVRARVTLMQNGKTVATEQGEVLFRDNGISGIAIFHCSSMIARRKDGGYAVVLDCFPDKTEQELCAIIAHFGTVGLCHKELAANVARRYGASPARLARGLKGYEIAIRSVGSLSLAQVVSGGVATEELDGHCRVRKADGLYVVGEAVNVDGFCGGYNLLWAWASGMMAGADV